MGTRKKRLLSFLELPFFMTNSSPIFSQKDQQKTAPIEEEEIDLLEIFHNIQKNKWFILFFTFFVSIIVFIYAYGKPPIYQANTLLRVESKKASIPGLDDFENLLGGGDQASVTTEIELIKSRNILSNAVKSLKLDIEAKPKRIPLLGYFYQHFFSPDNIKKLPPIWDRFDRWFYPYAWGNEQITVERFNIPEEFLNLSFTIVSKKDHLFELIFEQKRLLTGKIGQIAKSKDKKFSIFISKLTGLEGTEFTVTKLSERRARAKLKDAISASEKGKNTGLLNLSIEGINEQLIVQILDKISATYIEKNRLRSSKEANNALIFLEKQIKPVKESVDKAEANLRQYRTQNQTADLQQETQSVLGEIVVIDAELQKLSLLKEELSQKFTVNHPKVKVLINQANQLKINRDKISRKISKLPKKQQKLLEFERNIKVSNEIYIGLLNKIQEFKIAKASTVGNVYIVDPAEAKEYPIKPKRSLLIAVGITVSFILSIVIVILRNAFRSMVNNPEKLEEATGIPVYATVPLSKNVKLTTGFKHKYRRQKRLLAVTNIKDPAIESLRSLRTSLHFALHEAKNNILLITGPSPDIGKSFISSNFATVIAKANQKVVLVDADMRKGYLHKIFELHQSPGLSEIITERVNFEEAITPIQINDISMDIISRGKTPPNPSELLMNDNFEKLLKYLSANYDLVLVDSPPVHAVTDPSIIGSHAGVVFMVVYADRHSMQEIEHAVSRLAQTGVETKGFIFSGFEAKKSRYGYGYGYGYGSYYGEK
jgi:tyrosine-protein kinase Etk/Wzc